MEQEQLSSAIESILFMSERPVTIPRLIEVFGEEVVSEKELSETITLLKEKYQSGNYGYEIREAQSGFHFSTKAANVEWIRKFLQMKPFRLGKSALEALAIIAYRQPITRAEIDQVRGIDSSHLLRTLIERGLVRMAGKAEVPGRPVQYGTTPRFLEVMGLSSAGDLPPLSELDQIQGHTEDNVSPMEAGLDHFIQGQVTRSEVDATGEDTTGLQAIDEMIQSVQRPDREIHESQLHAEVARENESALEGFLVHMRPYRKSRGGKAAVVEEFANEAPLENGVEAAGLEEIALPEVPHEEVPADHMN